ncbi:hypothetical protein HAX54_030341 [Datura stramonium]|uniref:Uncharacterized protein n=1 Tax=Datura stramonium TaxID=4076 RepID=A0ABS8RKY0_DATST|nr:hypothetical protein [Datura stramonium]
MRAGTRGVLGFTASHNLSLARGFAHEQPMFSSRYLTMTAANEANGWYGGTLLGDQDESSEIYRHYAEFIQGPAMEPFEHDSENEKYYTELLLKGSVDAMDDAAIETEMESALKAYDQIGADLGIFPKSCKALAADPSQLTRWLVGEDKLPNV